MNESWYIFFGEDWGRHSSTGQFIAAEIAKTRKILWVNSLGLRTPSINISDAIRVVTKLYQFTLNAFKKNNKDCLNPSIHVVTPIVIPLYKYKIIRKINKILLSRFLRKQMKRLRVYDPIIISAGPEGVDVIDELDGKKTVYYCADKYAELPGLDKELVNKLESEIVKKVDIIIATSKALYNELKTKHISTHYIPHGVDFDLFSKALNSSYEGKMLLDGYGKPIIGFIGIIGPHLNYEIIETISAELPDASVVMIGPVEANANPPKGANIYYLGSKQRDELPEYIKCFDVCITPYVSSDRIKYANPTKVREYLAAGCPTVCTPQEEVKYITSGIPFAADGKEFVKEIRYILSEKTDRRLISKSISDQTWENKANEIMRLLEN